jgi:hypothetical protein
MYKRISPLSFIAETGPNFIAGGSGNSTATPSVAFGDTGVNKNGRFWYWPGPDRNKAFPMMVPLSLIA